MSKDIKMMEKQCRDMLNGLGYEKYVGKLPTITLNSRLKTTLGRCFSRWVNDNIDVYKIELNMGFFNAESEHNIKEVMLHEMVHGIANLIHNDLIGHDARWIDNR